MVWSMNILTWSLETDLNFLSFLKTAPSEDMKKSAAGDMLATIDSFEVYSYPTESNCYQKIGDLIEPDNFLTC